MLRLPGRRRSGTSCASSSLHDESQRALVRLMGLPPAVRPERVHVFDLASFAAAAAERIVVAVGAAVEERGGCALALSGGSTPHPVYEQMALSPLRERIAWERLTIYFGDERCVPPDDTESNYRMADEALLSRVPILRAAIHRMPGERPDHDAAAEDYARLLPDALDVLLLGVGDDGHTASLFPRSDALREETRRVVAVRGPAPPVRRLTITPPVIEAARTILVLASGKAKSAAIARALDGPWLPEEVPVQLARGGTWLLDRAAASALRSIST